MNDKILSPSLPFAVYDESLTVEEIKSLSLSGLSFLGITTSDLVTFEEKDGKKVSVKTTRVNVPEGTKQVFVYLGGHDLYFGTSTYIERPLSHWLLYFGITSFQNNEVSLQVNALLRDSYGDYAWGGHVQLAVVCLG